MAAVSSDVTKMVQNSIKKAMKTMRYTGSPQPAKCQKQSDFYGLETGDSEGDYTGDDTYSEYSDGDFSECVSSDELSDFAEKTNPQSPVGVSSSGAGVSDANPNNPPSPG